MTADQNAWNGLRYAWRRHGAEPSVGSSGSPHESGAYGWADRPGRRARTATPRRSVPRALGCAVASALVPGTGQAIQRRWRAAALFGLPTVAIVAGLVWAARHDRATLVDWSVDSGTLRALCVAGLAWALFCYMAAADAALAVVARPVSAAAAPASRAPSSW